jgi:hypothetical protein
MPSTDRKLELKAKTSVAQTDSQPYVYAKGLNSTTPTYHALPSYVYAFWLYVQCILNCII